MKENNYISVLDGLLRAKIYLWMIGVLFYVKSIYVVKFFLLAGIFLMGVSILCASAINEKNWITYLDDQFLCLLYLSYLLYPGRLCRFGHTDGRNIGSRSKSGKWNSFDVIYCGVLGSGSSDSRHIRYFFILVLNRFGSSK